VSPGLALLARDVKLAFREGGAIGTALGFYLVVIAIAPLGLGPDLNLLARIAPGLLWVALLLAALLSADRIFHNDYEDGALDVLTTGPLPLPLVAAIKSLAHWLTTGVPLALLAPLLGLCSISRQRRACSSCSRCSPERPRASSPRSARASRSG
jgi:heme exporter protein B